MTDGMFLHWIMDGQQYGWWADIGGKSEWKCRAFLRSELSILKGNLAGLTRLERRGWRKENGHGTITKAECGFVCDGHKEVLESWAAWST